MNKLSDFDIKRLKNFIKKAEAQTYVYLNKHDVNMFIKVLESYQNGYEDGYKEVKSEELNEVNDLIEHLRDKKK